MEKMPVVDRVNSLKSSLAIVVAAVALSGCSENSSGEKTTAPESPAKQKVEQTSTTTDSQPQVRQEPSSQADAYEPPTIHKSMSPEEVSAAFLRAINYSDPVTQCKLAGYYCGESEIAGAVPPLPEMEIEESYIAEEWPDTVTVETHFTGGEEWGMACVDVDRNAPRVVDHTLVLASEGC
jgi:hypothetical protein